MFQEICLPGSWGLSVVLLPPPLISDQNLAQAKVTDLRAQLVALLMAAQARTNPATQPLVRLLEHIRREIQTMGHVRDIPARKLDASLKAWQDLEKLTMLCVQLTSPKIHPQDPQVVELLRRWLCLQMAALDAHENAHALDGHPVKDGIIKDKRLVQNRPHG